MTFQHIFLRNSTMELIATAVFVLIGGLIFLYGTFLSKQTTLPPHLRSSWKQYLSGFSTNETLDIGENEDIQLAQRQWLRWVGAATMGMGIGVIAGVAGTWLLLLVILHLPFGLPLGVQMLTFAPVFWGIPTGSMLGGYIGSRKPRFPRFDEIFTDGSPSRRILDYRSPLMVFIVAIPFLVFGGVTLIFAPRYVAFNPDDIRDFSIIPPPNWILALYPCALLLTLIIAEAWVWIELKTSVPVRSHDSGLARHLNMRIVPQRMATYYFMALIYSALAGSGFIQLFAPILDEAGSGWFMSAWIVLYIACYGMGMVLMMSQGRMGGRLTGWPWTKERAARDGGTAVVGGDGAV